MNTQLSAPASGGKIKVAFLIHNAATWDSFHEIYLLMKQPGSGFLPRIFTIPCDHSSKGQYAGEDETYADLRAIGLTAVRSEDHDMKTFLGFVKNFAPQFLFRQSPWEKHLPPEFGYQQLDFTRMCYIPYGFMTAKIEQEQFNQPFHNACWAIFCESRLHKLLYEKNSRIGSRNVLVTGFPKFETFWKRKGDLYWPTQAPSGALKIIWAPHHSVTTNWLGFSTFVDNHMNFLGLAQYNPHLHIVLRPHPALFSKLRANGVSAMSIDCFIKKFTSFPNTAIYEEGDYVPLFNASDMLITDGIGFFSEYMLTGKPIIWTDSGRNIGFNPAGDMLVEGLYRARSFEEVGEKIAMLGRGDDPLFPVRETIRKVLFNPAAEFPSAKILAFLRQSVSA